MKDQTIEDYFRARKYKDAKGLRSKERLLKNDFFSTSKTIK